MNIVSARWANPDQTAVIVNDALIVSAREPELFQYLLAWIDAGHRPEPFRDHNDARRVRVLAIKDEARRRILALVPGSTLDNRHEKQINALMQATVRLYDAVALMAAGDAVGGRTIVDELAPLAAAARKIIAIRRASDRFEGLVVNTPADPVSWEIADPGMWP